jgi:hypothetical protein
MKNKTPDENWRMQVAKMKLMYPFLVEEDFLYDYGMRDVMMDKLQAKLGKTREELNQVLVSL